MNATQEALDGLTLESELREAVGFTRKEETETMAHAGLYGGATSYTVVTAADIAALRTDGQTDGARFLTVEAARAVLPAEFSPLTAHGVTYAAPRAVPTQEVRGFTAKQVEALRTALTELRTERAEAAAALKAATAKRRAAWVKGEPGVYLTYDDLRMMEDIRDGVRATPAPIVGASRLGRELPASAVSEFVRNGDVHDE